MPKPPTGANNKNWVAHWNGLELALNNGIPIVGVLKNVDDYRCSLAHVFDCRNPRIQVDGNAIWLQLVPRGEVGCDVTPIDIRQITMHSAADGSLAELSFQFERKVQESLRDTTEQRRARLATASRFPQRMEVTTMVFCRNPDVVAEVLYRAKGICQNCLKAAPFVRRTDGSPYLEVHHRIHLAAGGEDIVENAIALCPNCHRAAHYGKSLISL
jgi:5-methylcytosine-specific restriction endonuclease McrA